MKNMMQIILKVVVTLFIITAVVGFTLPRAQAFSPTVTNNSGKEIVTFALELKGIPFVFGGDSPESGFDCSGFTWYVMSHFGIDIERTADLQYHPEESISFHDLQAGDLVFFYGSPPEHVGIYIGNGQFIHVSDSSVTVVNLRGWYESKFTGGRRVR